MADDLRGMLDADRLIHEPARLVIVTILYAVASADFLYLLNETGLTKGNLSSHLARLEKADYVVIEKTFQGKIPRTICRLTDNGRAAFEAYRANMQRMMNHIADLEPAPDDDRESSEGA